jgi:hypothetical protein
MPMDAVSRALDLMGRVLADVEDTAAVSVTAQLGRLRRTLRLPGEAAAYVDADPVEAVARMLINPYVLEVVDAVAAAMAAPVRGEPVGGGAGSRSLVLSAEESWKSAELPNNNPDYVVSLLVGADVGATLGMLAPASTQGRSSGRGFGRGRGRGGGSVGATRALFAASCGGGDGGDVGSDGVGAAPASPHGAGHGRDDNTEVGTDLAASGEDGPSTGSTATARSEDAAVLAVAAITPVTTRGRPRGRPRGSGRGAGSAGVTRALFVASGAGSSVGGVAGDGGSDGMGTADTDLATSGEDGPSTASTATARSEDDVGVAVGAITPVTTRGRPRGRPRGSGRGAGSAGVTRALFVASGAGSSVGGDGDGTVGAPSAPATPGSARAPASPPPTLRPIAVVESKRPGTFDAAFCQGLLQLILMQARDSAMESVTATDSPVHGAAEPDADDEESALVKGMAALELQGLSAGKRLPWVLCAMIQPVAHAHARL